MRYVLTAWVDTGVGDIPVPSMGTWGLIITVVLLLGAWLIFGRKKGGSG